MHQSYFLPWLGYLSKLPFADKFIVLDNVNFTKGFYHDRTKYVNVDGEIKWLSLPIGQNFMLKCNEIKIADKSFLPKLTRTIESCYAKADYYRAEYKNLKSILENCITIGETLVEINICIIKSLLNYLDIKSPEFILSSTLGEFSDRTERIISLCKLTNCDSLIIGGGKSLKEHDWDSVKAEGIKIYLQDYYKFHPIYKQVRRQRLGFEKGVSTIDALLNVGREKTREFIIDSKFEPELTSIK